MASKKSPTRGETKRKPRSKGAETPEATSTAPTSERSASPLSVAITGGPDPSKPRKGRKKWRDSLTSRARELEDRSDAENAPPPPGPESTTEARVSYIVDEMAAGRWDGYVSRAPLSKAWGVGDSRIRELAAQAGRLLAYDPEERDHKRATMAAWFAQQRARMVSERSAVTGLPDNAAALKAAELEARFLGIELASKVEVTGKDGGPLKGDVTLNASAPMVIMLPAEQSSAAPAEEGDETAQAP